MATFMLVNDVLQIKHSTINQKSRRPKIGLYIHYILVLDFYKVGELVIDRYFFFFLKECSKTKDF